MILIHLLIIAVTTTTAYPQRRNHNVRKTKLFNDYINTPTPFTTKALDEHKYRKQYIPIRQMNKYNKEPEISSRSDHFLSQDVDDLLQKYASNRTIRNNLKKYVTTDEIRPTRSQYATSMNLKKNINKHERNDNFELYDERPNPSYYQNHYKPQKKVTIIKNDDKLYQQSRNEIASENYPVTLTTSRPQDDKYSTFTVDQYQNNPFLASVLKKSPTTGFLPPIEITPSSVQYLPPIQTTAIFSPSPEIPSRNYESILIPLNVDAQMNFQASSPTNDDIIFDPNVNMGQMNQMEEIVTAAPAVIQPDVQHLPPNPPGNVFLPPRFPNEIYQIQNTENHFHKDYSNAIDPFQQEAMREMSFESVKINGSPSSTPKPVRNFSPSPLGESISPTVREIHITPSTRNKVINVEENNPQLITETNLTSQRRNDYSVYYQQDPYQKRPIQNTEQQFYMQPTNYYPTNPNERSSRDQNWLPNEETVSEQSRRLHIEETQVEKEHIASPPKTPYGTKIGQQPYPFAAERSNAPQTTFESSVSTPDTEHRKSFESTTVNYDSINVNNIKHPQELMHPTSSVRQIQEFNDFIQPQEDVNPSQNNFDQNQEYTAPHNVLMSQEFSNAANIKPQEYVSTSTYPKDFTKALKTYVDKQNVKQKQEKPVEKQLRQPKDYPKDLLQRSEQATYYNSNELFEQYGDQFSNPHHDVYSQQFNYTNKPTTESIPVLRQTKEMAIDGSFHYETLIGDQTHVIQEGHIENPGTDDEEQVIHGSYSFLGDDGKTYTVNYVADANGFRAAGDHLPTPPPVPEIIQRSIEKNLAEAEKNPDILDENYRYHSGFNDLNGIRDRSSKSNPIYTNNNKNVNTELKPPPHSRNLSFYQQPKFQEVVIQPRKDVSRRTESYSKGHSEGNVQNQSGGNKDFIQRRSDQGHGEVFIEKPNIMILNERESKIINDNKNDMMSKDSNNNNALYHNDHNNEEIQRWKSQEINNYEKNQYHNDNTAGNQENNMNNYNKMDYDNANSNHRITEQTTAVPYKDQNDQVYYSTHVDFNVDSNSRNVYNSATNINYRPNEQVVFANDPHETHFNGP